MVEMEHEEQAIVKESVAEVVAQSEVVAETS